ncbi:hypothetical protein F8O09_05400 [Pseudoclavibacter sp. CFCC 11306]|nr:hypothetical protein F8O09_05400 [Pseudoclavibacter sp. CFCC 11306]
MTLATKYRKRPVEIEAMILKRDNVDDVARWCGGRVLRESKASDPTDVYVALEIPTLEGVMRAETRDPTGLYSHGDAVIRGVNGEFYPCKPDIFAKTYELA